MKIRNIEIGSGTPKICVPLASSTLSSLLDEAALVRSSKADLAEWRVDYFEDCEYSEIMQALRGLRIALSGIPLLFTFRTIEEGGKRQISRKEYLALNRAAAASGFVDLLDAEISGNGEIIGELIGTAHEHGVKVILSHHNFDATPTADEMLEILENMRTAGGDIAKLAVMPQSFGDVLALLDITSKFTLKNPCFPTITMSMGKLGVISRAAGGFSGSAITFAALKEATAPGQIAADDLSEILRLLYDN